MSAWDSLSFTRDDLKCQALALCWQRCVESRDELGTKLRTCDWGQTTNVRNDKRCEIEKTWPGSIWSKRLIGTCPPQKKQHLDIPGPPALVFVGGSSCLSSLLIMGFLYGFHPKANRGLAGALEVIGNWVFFFASQKTLHPSFQSYFVKQDSTQSWLMTEFLEHPALKVGSCSPWRWGISMWFTVKFWFFVGNGCLAAGGARNSGAPKTPRGGHCQRVKGKISCVFSAETFAKHTSFWRDRSYFPLRHDY